MKTKELIKILKKGVNPIIKFTENIYNIESADEGMMGRVVGFHTFDKWDNSTETVFIKIDMSEFVDYNRSIAKPDWKDNKGYNLIWHDTVYYPKNHIEEICEMYIENGKDAELSLIEISEPRDYFKEWMTGDMKINYVKFLEDKLDSITKNI